jgi:hypothetical protein
MRRNPRKHADFIIYLYMRSTCHGYLSGSRARVEVFYARCNFARGYNVKPAPVPVGRKRNPYPRPIGFLPAGTRVICARCHP